jgi:dinuclear metal center YbgI/SA1388 family protein
MVRKELKQSATEDRRHKAAQRTTNPIMILKELVSYLDSEIPLSFQEDYDNSGLQIGLTEQEISQALLTLDVTEEVIGEAISSGCDVIISHHPLIFKAVRKITGKTASERIIRTCIQHGIAVYSAHTNLDMLGNGVSRKIAVKMNLKDIEVLSPLGNKLLKLVTYIPESHLEKVRMALFEAGAGVIGNYDQCGFAVDGTGSFRGGENTNPYTGRKGKIHFEREVRFETVLFSYMKEKVIGTLLKVHPYEEVAYDLYALANTNSGIGLGCTGILENPMNENDLLHFISKVFNTGVVKYSKLTGKMVTKVALCGGSGASLLPVAIGAGADVFITSDIKYHTFFDAENKILIIDVGHFESEKFSTEILYDLIIKKFPKFAVRFSEINTNPINYL